MNKIQKYFKFQREIDKTKRRESILEAEKDKIFMSKFKTGGLYTDASGIFDVFFNNPDKSFDRWSAIRSSQWKWSDESLRRNINKIFKTFYEEEFIVRDGRGYYTINPEYLNTIKRNQKKDSNELE